MYPKIFYLLGLLFTVQIATARASQDIQLNYVLKQLSQAIKSGNENGLQNLVSDDFVLGPYKEHAAKKALFELKKGEIVKVELRAPASIGADERYAVGLAQFRNGKRLKFGISWNGFYEFTRIGLFEQLMGESDPVLNRIAPAKRIASVPLKLVKGKILIPVQIGEKGRMLNLIFDSGAGGTTLDKGIAAEMFPVIGAMKEVTTSAGKKADLAGVGETNLQVAGIKIKAPNTTVTDFAPFTKILGEPVYGLLGYDLLKEHLVELDLKNMRLNIYSGAQIKVKNTLQLPIDFYKNTPIVEMSLYGGSKAFKGRFMLDTGADGEVFINTYGGFKSRLLEALRQPKTETALDIAGNYSERISGTIDSLNLGGLQMLKPELQIEKNKRIQWSDIDGMIGLDLIKKYNIWFNYPNRRILIEQNYKQ